MLEKAKAFEPQRAGGGIVGAALAAKLLFAPITLVDKRTMFVKSTSEVDLFVPKGTPTSWI